MFGFTFIELMVVTIIIGILASIGVPRMRGYLASARLEEAKPYMMAISAREKIYFNETGSYFAASDEQDLEDILGVDLRDAGNFCFMVYCASSCIGSNFAGPIVGAESGDSTIEFEIWAALRNSNVPGSNVTTSTGTSCTTADDKVNSTNWVVDNDSTVFAGEGRVVVLRYPAPPNRVDSSSPSAGNGNAYHDWTEGFSASDVLTP